QSATMDRAVVMQSGVARGWLFVALLGLAPAFVAGAAEPSTLAVSLAVSLGGMLLAYRALAKLAASLSSLLSAAIAWRQVSPLLNAAARCEEAGSLLAEVGHESRESGAVVEAHDLTFRYRERGEPVLRGCSLRI